MGRKKKNVIENSELDRIENTIEELDIGELDVDPEDIFNGAINPELIGEEENDEEEIGEKKNSEPAGRIKNSEFVDKKKSRKKKKSDTNISSNILVPKKKDKSMLVGVKIREENDLIILINPEFEKDNCEYDTLASYNPFFKKLYVGKYCTDEQLEMFEQYLVKNTNENRRHKVYEVIKTKPIPKIPEIIETTEAKGNSEIGKSKFNRIENSDSKNSKKGRKK